MAQVKYGTGTIFKDGDKWRWQGCYVDELGKKHRPSRTFRTEEEALKFQAEQTAQNEVKKAKKSKAITAEEAFQLWCEAVRAGKEQISETTRKNSIRNWRAHLLPLLGSDPIKVLSVTKIDRYFKKLIDQGRSKRTVYNIYADLLKVIKFATKQGIIYNNPIADLIVENPKPSKKIVNVMSFKEYELLVGCKENKESYYYNAIIFLAETGLRAEELAIKKNDYFVTEDGLAFVVIEKSVVRALKDDDLTSHIIVSDNVKNDNSDRRVPLNVFAQNAVENQLAYCQEHGIHSPFIFCTTTGGMLDQRNLLRALHMMCKNAGIPRRGLHSLRKLYINHTLRNGVAAFDLAKVTGHSLQTMFKYYRDLDEEMLKTIADASESRK